MSGIRDGQVTAADVMRQLSDVGRDVSSANTKLAVIDERTANAASDLTDHESRLRVLEQFRNKLLGISIVVSIASGAASGVVGYVLGHLH